MGGETRSDQEGRWTYIEVEPLKRGVYRVSARTQDTLGVKSNPSEEVTVLVSPPVFFRIGALAIDYLTTIIVLSVLLIALIFGALLAWQKIKEKRKKMKKEINEADKALRKTFEALKEETEEQIAKLDGKAGLSTKEKKIYNDLKEALTISEKFIGKEIRDIEKELDK